MKLIAARKVESKIRCIFAKVNLVYNSLFNFHFILSSFLYQNLGCKKHDYKIQLEYSSRMTEKKPFRCFPSIAREKMP